MNQFFRLFSSIFICVLFVFPSFAQQGSHQRIKVHFDEEYTVKYLAALGVEADHGFHLPGRFLVHTVSKAEIERIKQAGFQTEVLIPDIQSYYALLNEQPISAFSRAAGCDDLVPDPPVNFDLGSMGGFFTYQEALDMLNSMADQYPDLISPIAPIPGHQTIEGRPIYWLRLSDNPLVDEDEPEVLYTAVHHAREPGSLAQMIYYLWHMLENYDTDPEIQYLLQETELYFIPVINPDGYIYNELTNPDGGGLWRKNKRDNNGDGQFTEDIDGVDLNRNYGFQWGDLGGSSGDPGSAIYRGASAFSEPETQAVSDFCNQHEFQFALNYHTFGRLHIYPWAYSDETADPLFPIFARAMTAQNDYFAGTTSETVGYAVNGSSDDWFYGEENTKDPIYSFTPEVGTSFWPGPNTVYPFSQEVLDMNLTTARLVLNYGDFQQGVVSDPSVLDGSIEFSLQKLGLKDGPLTISLAGVSSNVIMTSIPQEFNLMLAQEETSTASYSLDPAIQNGEIVELEWRMDNGEFVWTIPYSFVYGDDEVIISNSGTPTDFDQTLPNTDWNVTSLKTVSPPFSMTDSPSGGYQGNTINYLQTEDPIDLSNAVDASMRLYILFEVAPDGFDYAQIQASTDDGATWVPLCGEYTTNGPSALGDQTPIYSGYQEDFVLETLDLSDFIGQQVKIRFEMTSNGFWEEDGFYFDDLEIVKKTPTVVSTTELQASDFQLITRPNPAADYAIVDLPKEGQYDQVQVFNALGQIIFQTSINRDAQVILPTTDWKPGIYFLRAQGNQMPDLSDQLIVE